jgi:hypothetical protein
MLLDRDHRQGGCFNLPWAISRELANGFHEIE